MIETSPIVRSSKQAQFLAYLLISMLLLSQTFEQDLMCKKTLTESYGIFSYTSPAREKLILCPSVKATCCPAYQQLKVFNHYNAEIKPYFKMFEQVINNSLKIMKNKVGRIINRLKQAIFVFKFWSLIWSSKYLKRSFALEELSWGECSYCIQYIYVYFKRS